MNGIINAMTDETFTAYDIRGKIENGVSLDTAWNIGKALADWLSTYGKVTLMRGTGADEQLVGALIEGLRLQGRDVLDSGVGDKETLMKRVADDGLSGGIIVSRDEQQDVCVIELFNEKSELISAENGLEDIAQLVGAGNFVPAAEKGELTALV